MTIHAQNSPTIRQLTGAQVQQLTPASFQLAPIFDRLQIYARPHGALFLAEIDGQPAAVAATIHEGDTLHIEHFVVSPRFRGHGLGGHLMRRCISHARAIGAAKVRAQAPGWCPEWRAFFTRLGFTYIQPDTAHSMTEMTPVELDLRKHL